MTTTSTSELRQEVSGQTAIDLRGVHKHFGKVKAVRGIDLAIDSGEIVALLGPNGAGKTTTIDMILGLSQPTDGQVSVYGTHPRQAIERGMVSAVLQVGGLLKDLTVAETAKYTASLFPGSRPLDEPTTGMDVEGRREFWAAIRKDAELGRTVLFATHYLEEADAYADRIVLLRQGEIVADGTGAEVKALASGRTVRATLPDPDEAALRAIPGADGVEVRGETVLIHSKDSDAVARFLLTKTAARDLEINTRGLEDAFIALTSDDNATANAGGAAGVAR